MRGEEKMCLFENQNGGLFLARQSPGGAGPSLQITAKTVRG